MEEITPLPGVDIPLQMAHGLTPDQLNGLTLAFVGDSVFELLVRRRLASVGNMPAGKLHAKAIFYVSAKGQAAGLDPLLEQLTEKENQIFHRGRNASGIKPPKNADFIEYRMATGLESLFGYLYLTGQTERIFQLFELFWQTRSAQASQG